MNQRRHWPMPVFIDGKWVATDQIISRDTDHGGGPYGDDDIRLIYESQSIATRQASNIGQMTPNKDIIGLNVLRVQQGRRRLQRKAAGA